jgi:hypothetical protein
MSAAAPVIYAVAPFPSNLKGEPLRWVLYFHDPKEESWLAGSYAVIAIIDSWEKLWSTFHSITNDHLLTGMYFLMKEGNPPQWEHALNKKGGTYQIKVNTNHAREAYETYCAAAIMQIITKDSANVIKGVSMSFKKGHSQEAHNIIKMWNNDATKYSKKDDIHVMSTMSGDILYMPAVNKRW